MRSRPKHSREIIHPVSSVLMKIPPILSPLFNVGAILGRKMVSCHPLGCILKPYKSFF